MNAKCIYCKKYYRHSHDSDKCAECDEQMRIIIASINEKYANAIKKVGIK